MTVGYGDRVNDSNQTDLNDDPVEDAEDGDFPVPEIAARYVDGALLPEPKVV